MSRNIWKLAVFTIIVVFLGGAILYGVLNLMAHEDQFKAARALIDVPRITLLPNSSLNFTFANQTLIFIASSLPLKIESQNIEVYFLEDEIGFFDRRVFKFTEIVAPPNVTIRVVNNYTVPVSFAVNTMTVPPNYEVVDGMLKVPPDVIKFHIFIYILIVGVAWAAFIFGWYLAKLK